MSRWD